MGKKQFCFFQTAETGNRTPDSGVKGSGANHYPRAPAPSTNRTTDTNSLPLAGAINTTITTYGTSKHIVDVGLKRQYAWTFIIADIKQPIIGADFFIHYNLLVDLKSLCLRDMRTGLAIPATLSSIKPLSLNRINTIRNEYTELLDQFP